MEQNTLPIKSMEYKYLIAFNCCTAFVCMNLQLSLSTCLSYIFSSSIYAYSLFTGIYLMAMGGGAIIVHKINVDRNNIIKVVLLNAFFIMLIANPGITGVIYLNEYFDHQFRFTGEEYLTTKYVLSITLTILLGVASGIELPLFSKLFKYSSEGSSKDLIGILVSDYLGAFIGTILFAFIIYPYSGIIDSVLIPQTILIIVMLFMMFKFSLFKSFKIMLFLISFKITLQIISYSQLDTFYQVLDGFSL